MAARAVEGEL
jgi:hypothetical protein